MNDTAPAYAQALDQLRRERDDLRARVAELETGPCGEDCTPTHAHAAVVTERDRLRTELATLRAMFHAAIDAAGRMP